MTARPARLARLEDAGVREARRLAGLAADAYREHIGTTAAGIPACVQCSVSASRRQPNARCEAGRRLDAERLEAAAALRREQAAAAAPNPDQAALFGPAEIGGIVLVNNAGVAS